MDTTRRRFGSHLTGAAVGAALAACGAQGADGPVAGTLPKRAVVLVHGSWFGAWCFAKLIYLSAFMPVTPLPAGAYLQLPEAAASLVGNLPTTKC